MLDERLQAAPDHALVVTLGRPENAAPVGDCRRFVAGNWLEVLEGTFITSLRGYVIAFLKTL